MTPLAVVRVFARVSMMDLLHVFGCELGYRTSWFQWCTATVIGHHYLSLPERPFVFSFGSREILVETVCFTLQAFYMQACPSLLLVMSCRYVGLVTEGPLIM